MRILFTLPLFAANLAFAECPAPKDFSVETAALMAQVKVAPDSNAAQLITNELWGIWATAPDARAQEMLDDGLHKRDAFDLDGAWEAFDQLIAYCPDYAEGYNQRAFVAFIRQDYVSALDDLEKAIERNPDHVAAIAGKALTEMGLDGPEAGQATLREALKMNPWLKEKQFLLEDDAQEL